MGLGAVSGGAGRGSAAAAWRPLGGLRAPAEPCLRSAPVSRPCLELAAEAPSSEGADVGASMLEPGRLWDSLGGHSVKDSEGNAVNFSRRESSSLGNAQRGAKTLRVVGVTLLSLSHTKARDSTATARPVPPGADTRAVTEAGTAVGGATCSPPARAAAPPLPQFSRPDDPPSGFVAEGKPLGLERREWYRPSQDTSSRSSPRLRTVALRLLHVKRVKCG